ncbi:MAG: C39 family peptidase [Elusimicrobia bacterium]|nr:C39 family peptidase [Elusimicrobiota bacterium]
MRCVGPLCLGALLLVGAGRAASAAVATGASVRLSLGLGAPAVPLTAPGFRLESFQGLALSLSAPGVALPSLPAPMPALQPAALIAAPVPVLRSLDGVTGRLTEGSASGRQDGRPVLDRFFDASGPRYGAPAVSGLPQPSIPADYQPVPIVEQETGYSCGAAAALAVLRYWRAYDGDERSLYELLGTRPKDGTPPDNMARAFSQLGLDSALRENMTLEDLRLALRQGASVILDIQAWREDEDTPWSERWDDGHYVVLTGMDEHYAYVMDPSTPERYTYLSLAELLERWHDYEDRDGQLRRYYQTGIVVRGRQPLPRPSEPPLPPGPIKLTRGPRSLVR